MIATVNLLQNGGKPIPHTFLFDGNKQIVWNHPGYTGYEDKLLKKYLKSPNEKICNNYFIFIFFQQSPKI